MPDILARLRHTIARLGWLNGCLYGLDRVLERLTGDRWRVHRYYFVAQRLGDAPLCDGRGADIGVQLLARAAQLPDGYPRPPQVLRQRYAQGAYSLAAWRRGELIGFLWLAHGAYQEDEVRVRYRLASSASAWDFDVWVRPQDRLGWAFRRLWDEARARLRLRAVRWSCSRISAFNPDSLRAHARIGTMRLGSAVFLRCGGWQWMLASLAPYCHLSRRPTMFPTLSFDTARCDAAQAGRS